MKGLKTVFIVIIGLLCLTGCGEKRLTCTHEENDSGVKTNQKIEMKFKDDKVTAIKMSIDSKATDEEAKSSWNMVTSLLEAAYEEVDEEGLKVTFKNDEKNYSYNLTFDVDLAKVKEENLEKYDLDSIVDSTSSLEEVKKSAEEDGFTCK